MLLCAVKQNRSFCCASNFDQPKAIHEITQTDSKFVSVISCEFLAPHAGCPRGDPAWIVSNATFGWGKGQADQTGTLKIKTGRVRFRARFVMLKAQTLAFL